MKVRIDPRRFAVRKNDNGWVLDTSLGSFRGLAISGQVVLVATLAAMVLMHLGGVSDSLGLAIGISTGAVGVGLAITGICGIESVKSGGLSRFCVPDYWAGFDRELAQKIVDLMCKERNLVDAISDHRHRAEDLGNNDPKKTEVLRTVNDLDRGLKVVMSGIDEAYANAERERRFGHP